LAELQDITAKHCAIKDVYMYYNG